MNATASDYASQPDTYFTDQLNNRDALVGYRKIGEELLEQFPSGIDTFCAAVGVAGLSMGVATEFADAGASTRFEILEPAESAFLSTGEAGTHHVEGIGIGFRPPLLDDRLYDAVRAIPQERAMTTTRRLTAEEGVFSGWSTGLNVTAALDIAAELGPGHTVVTVAVDSGLKYLSGDLYR
jgi:cysteine synthase